MQKRILCCPGPNIDEKLKESGTTESTNGRYVMHRSLFAAVFLQGCR